MYAALTDSLTVQHRRGLGGQLQATGENGGTRLGLLGQPPKNRTPSRPPRSHPGESVRLYGQLGELLITARQNGEDPVRRTSLRNTASGATGPSGRIGSRGPRPPGPPGRRGGSRVRRRG